MKVSMLITPLTVAAMEKDHQVIFDKHLAAKEHKLKVAALADKYQKMADLTYQLASSVNTTEADIEIVHLARTAVKAEFDTEVKNLMAELDLIDKLSAELKVKYADILSLNDTISLG